MMNKKLSITLAAVISAMISGTAMASPSAIGGNFDTQDFYKPFTTQDITPENMQRWPYYKHVSANWDDYVQTSSASFTAATNPAKLYTQENGFDLNGEFANGKSYLQSLVDTQTKAFVVLKDNKVLAEFYDNGFNVDQTNLLQSASKSFAGVIIHQLVDQGKLDLNTLVANILPDFAGTVIGKATVQQVLDMTSGAATLLDFHTKGKPGYEWEVEIGLKQGKGIGHRESIKAARKAAEAGTAWNYTDKNTDALALIAEQVSGQSFQQLMQNLVNEYGGNSAGSIALASDGKASPSYGISLTVRDYALFHQWIAQGNAPKSYYASVTDANKKLIQDNEVAATLFDGVTYGSQTYYVAKDNLLYSSGSFGQIGFSDLESGISVVTFQDWAVNAEPEKFLESRERMTSIIKMLRK
ncbi:hypothetical protein C9I91_07910 [Photobacterium jeanii]|nr:hypothetical protein C9I91_07910 [Photobacterium jeanii]